MSGSAKSARLLDIATGTEVAAGQKSGSHETLPGTRHPAAVTHIVVFGVDLPVGVWIVVFVRDVAGWLQNANVLSVRKSAAELRRGKRTWTVVWQVDACFGVGTQEFVASREHRLLVHLVAVLLLSTARMKLLLNEVKQVG